MYKKMQEAILLQIHEAFQNLKAPQLLKIEPTQPT